MKTAMFNSKEDFYNYGREVGIDQPLMETLWLLNSNEIATWSSCMGHANRGTTYIAFCKYYCDETLLGKIKEELIAKGFKWNNQFYSISGTKFDAESVRRDFLTLKGVVAKYCVKKD